MANGKAKKEYVKQADHTLLDLDGNPFAEDDERDETQAYGYRYALVAGGNPFDWHWDEAKDDERRMLAIFGAKTLCTNETSQARQKGNTDPESQMTKIRDRFDLIRNGTWVSGVREAAVVDQAVLAAAICKHLVAIGKKTQADIDAGHYESVLKKLAEDNDYLKKAARHPQVSTYYAEAKGRTVISDDELAAA